MSVMLREIEDQPGALERTYQRGLGKARRLRTLSSLRNFRLVVLVARGTSDTAALFGRYLIEITTGIPVSLCAPSVHTLYHSGLRLEGALAVGLSQSGEDADVNLTLESCRQHGAYTLGMTNEPKSSMVALVDECWFVHAGKERSMGATKTYTGQLLLFYLLTWALGGRVVLEDVARLPDHAERALKLRPQVESLVERYRFLRHAAVVARGLNYANAWELARKLTESCDMVAERFSSANFLPAPPVVESSFPVILFAPQGPTQEDTTAILRQLQELRAESLVISCRPLDKLATRLLRLPMALQELYTPIPYIIPGQLFAALLATAKGLNSDTPRQLAKRGRSG